MTGMGARLILKSRYVDASKNQSGETERYARYIGTREGSVKIEKSRRDEPATEPQMKFIKEMVRDIPELERSPAFYEYEKSGTIGSASRLIDSAMEDSRDRIEGLEGYVEYMAKRPGVTDLGKTGLFSDTGTTVDMKEVMDELREYPGNVYLPIISLRPEDSIGLGYDNPEAWQRLLSDHRDEIAREYKIPTDHFRWVAAYHNAVNSEGYVHNHVHMMLWSTNPADGYQTVKTGNNIRSILAKDIFREELKMTYEKGSKTRDQIREEAGEQVKRLAEEVSEKRGGGVMVQKEFLVLAESLKSFRGRKYYSYLSGEQKQMVDNIMNDLVDSTPKLKELLEAWAETRDRQISIYSNGKYTLPSVSEIDDFKPIKNEIVRQAFAYNKSAVEMQKIEHDLDRLSEKREHELQRTTEYITSSIIRTASRLSKPVRQKMPRKIHVRDAEEIDAQVRRSQGMH